MKLFILIRYYINCNNRSIDQLNSYQQTRRSVKKYAIIIKMITKKFHFFYLYLL